MMTEPIGLGGSEDRQNTGTVWSPRSCNRYEALVSSPVVFCSTAPHGRSLSPEFYHFQFHSVDP